MTFDDKTAFLQQQMRQYFWWYSSLNSFFFIWKKTEFWQILLCSNIAQIAQAQIVGFYSRIVDSECLPWFSIQVIIIIIIVFTVSQHPKQNTYFLIEEKQFFDIYKVETTVIACCISFKIPDRVSVMITSIRITSIRIISIRIISIWISPMRIISITITFVGISVVTFTPIWIPAVGITMVRIIPVTV